MVYTFALVIVLFAPDLSGYKDIVGVFPDEAACEMEKTEKVAQAEAMGVRYVMACLKLAGGPQT